PSLTRTPLRFPRLGLAQLALFFIGVSGMITHFALGQWSGVWSAALVVIASIVLFTINMFTCLWKQIGRAASDSGIAISIAFLLVAACAGFALALDKSHNFLGGDVVSNIAGHASLAAIGWVAIAVCAVSYRMLPAFLLPTGPFFRFKAVQIAALAAGVAGLATALFAESAAAIVAAAVVVAALALYLAMVARMASKRRAPMIWPLFHAFSGLVFLVVSSVLGLVLARIGAQSIIGARMASAYGLCGLLGFFSNFIIGISYQLLPGFVAKARTARGWPPKASMEFVISVPRAFVFTAFNVGIIIAAAGLLLNNVPVAQIGAVLSAAGGIVYAGGLLQTLSRAYLQRL
ncbi:MAG TPA: hypothetical protein VJ718_09410, partial [Candidatus Binataceae bacterium]|nr:hypothetical protein [Candidatus Binataceae bacterium]